MTSSLSAPSTARLTPADVRLEDFVAVVQQTTDLAAYPHADRVDQDVLVYDAARLRAVTTTEAGRDDVSAELVRALTDGPGVVLFEGAFPDHAVVDRVTAAFDAMIAEEEAAGGEHGDHFAAPGANSRVWNALEKLALRDPEAFVDYYANDVIALVSRAWLGPAYQVTSQVNVVRPGGQAQDPHRDYHLGFLEDDVVAAYPTHVHALSPVLTLQGAVAHSDMPLESGPTLYLPYSHQYLPGYLAWRRPEFRAYFLEHRVQLPLEEGRRRLLQPRGVPRRRHQRQRRHPADGQPAAGLLGVRPGHGAGRPGPRGRGGVRRAAGQPARPRRARQRRRGVGRGLPVPDQPRPRPAGRRAHAALAGPARAPRAGRGLGAGRAHGGAQRLHRPAPHLARARCTASPPAPATAP